MSFINESFINEACAEEAGVSKTTEVAATAGKPNEYGWINSLVPMLLVLVVFYFFVIRPNEKKRAEHSKLLSSIKKGDRIITSSGIIGKVVDINDSENCIIMEVDNGVNIKILRSAIGEVKSGNV